MIETEKSPLDKHYNNFFRQELLMDIKTGKQKYSKKSMHSVKVSPHEILITKRKIVNYSKVTWQNPP